MQNYKQLWKECMVTNPVCPRKIREKRITFAFYTAELRNAWMRKARWTFAKLLREIFACPPQFMKWFGHPPGDIPVLVCSGLGWHHGGNCGMFVGVDLVQWLLSPSQHFQGLLNTWMRNENPYLYILEQWNRNRSFIQNDLNYSRWYSNKWN